MTFKIYYKYRDARNMMVTASKYATPTTLELQIKRLKQDGCRVIKVTAMVEVSTKAASDGGIYSMY